MLDLKKGGGSAMGFFHVFAPFYTQNKYLIFPQKREGHTPHPL